MAADVRRDRQAGNSEASLSFLDVIACAFGAIVLLVLILPVGETSGPEPGVDLGAYGNLLLLLDERRAAAAALEEQLAADRRQAAALDDLVSARKTASNALRDLVAQTQAETRAVQGRTQAVREARAEAAAAARALQESRLTEYAGIPVDSEYVAIVVDTSGSMRTLWPEVVREIDSVLSIYPAIRGFQILSASGGYLWKPGGWIEDTPGNRNFAKTRLPFWNAYSASNPEPGILTAVRDLYRPDIKMAIFVFGDDYQGTDYDNFLGAVQAGVDHHASPEGELRIHAFGFRSESPPQRAKYATLMRELTRRHGGAFLALSG